jgi:hypothetical protein
MEGIVTENRACKLCTYNAIRHDQAETSNQGDYSPLQFYLGILSARPYFSHSHYYSSARWTGCRPSHYYARHWLLTRSSEVVRGSKHVISYCAEHGGRGVYLNKIEKDYRTTVGKYSFLNRIARDTGMCYRRRHSMLKVERTSEGN